MQVLRRFRLLELTHGMDVGTLVRGHLLEQQQQQQAPQAGPHGEAGVGAADLPASPGVHVPYGRPRAHEGAFSTPATARPSLDCADGPTGLPRTAGGVGGGGAGGRGAWGRGLQNYIARRSGEYQQQQQHHQHHQQVFVSPFAVANASAGGAEHGGTTAADAGRDEVGGMDDGGGGGGMTRRSRPRRLRASSITLAILARRFGLPHPAMIVEEQHATGGGGGAGCGAAAPRVAAPAVAMSGERGLDQGLFTAAATAEVLHNNTPVLLSTCGTVAGEVFSSGMLSRVTSQGAPFPASAASPCVGCAASGAAGAAGAGQPGARYSGRVGEEGHGNDREGGEEDEEEEGICGVCFDAAGSVSIERCGHRLCTDCCRELVRMNGLRPAQCPFCRACIAGLAVADGVASHA